MKPWYQNWTFSNMAHIRDIIICKLDEWFHSHQRVNFSALKWLSFLFVQWLCSWYWPFLADLLVCLKAISTLGKGVFGSRCFNFRTKFKYTHKQAGAHTVLKSGLFQLCLVGCTDIDLQSSYELAPKPPLEFYRNW